MLEISILIMAAIGVLLFTRLTEKPFRVRFEATEDTVNVYKQNEINLPFVGITGGRAGAQAIELMKVKWRLGLPTNENAQLNRLDAALHKDSDDSIRAWNNENGIDIASWENHNIGTGGSVQIGNTVFEHDMTDGDGNGEIIVERSIFIAIEGTGNASVKGVQGYMLCHLVEIDADELAAQLLADDL